MDGEGFEPSKASPADLQSVPFGHSGIRPQRITLSYSHLKILSYKQLFGKLFFIFFKIFYCYIFSIFLVVTFNNIKQVPYLLLHKTISQSMRTCLYLIFFSTYLQQYVILPFVIIVYLSVHKIPFSIIIVCHTCIACI